MRLLSFYSNRVSSVAAGAVFLFFTAIITGCASKNPLIDEPVVAGKSPVAAPTQKQPPAPVQTAEAKSALAPATTGAQVTKQRRFLGIFSPSTITL